MRRGIAEMRSGRNEADLFETNRRPGAAERKFTVTSRKVGSPGQKIPLKFVDPKMVLDENEKWGKLYNEIITRQAR